MKTWHSFKQQLSKLRNFCLLILIIFTNTNVIQSQVIEVNILDSVTVNGAPNDFLLKSSNFVLFSNSLPSNVSINTSNFQLLHDGRLIQCMSIESFSLQTTSAEVTIEKQTENKGLFVIYCNNNKLPQKTVAIYAKWLIDGVEYSTNSFMFVQYDKEYPICMPPSISISKDVVSFKTKCLNNGHEAKRAYIGVSNRYSDCCANTKGYNQIDSNIELTEFQYTFNITIDSLKSLNTIQHCVFDFSNEPHISNNSSGSAISFHYFIKGDTALIVDKNIYSFSNYKWTNNDSISLINMPIVFLEDARIENDSLVFCFAKNNVFDKFNSDAISFQSNPPGTEILFTRKPLNSTPVNKTNGMLFKAPISVFTQDSMYQILSRVKNQCSPVYSFIIHNDGLIVLDNNYRNPLFMTDYYGNERLYQLKLPYKFTFGGNLPEANPIEIPYVSNEIIIDTLYLTKEQRLQIDKDINKQLNIRLQRKRNRNSDKQLKDCYKTIEESKYLGENKKDDLKQDVKRIRVYTGKLKRNKELNAAEIMISNDYLFEYINILNEISKGNDSSGIDTSYYYLRDFLFDKLNFYYPGLFAINILCDSVFVSEIPLYGMSFNQGGQTCFFKENSVNTKSQRNSQLFLRAYTLDNNKKRQFDETLTSKYSLTKYNGYSGKTYVGTMSIVDNVFYYVLTAIEEDREHTFYFIDGATKKRVSDETTCIIFGTYLANQRMEIQINP